MHPVPLPSLSLSPLIVGIPPSPPQHLWFYPPQCKAQAKRYNKPIYWLIIRSKWEGSYAYYLGMGGT
jgi:hypothetical protein